MTTEPSVTEAINAAQYAISESKRGYLSYNNELKTNHLETLITAAQKAEALKSRIKELEAMTHPSENQRALEAISRLEYIASNGGYYVSELYTIAETFRKALSRDVGWQTIDSAPRDGTRLLTYNENGWHEIFWWGVDPNNDTGESEWLSGDGDDWSTGYYYSPCSPSYFQPLPSPPSTKPEEKE